MNVGPAKSSFEETLVMEFHFSSAAATLQGLLHSWILGWATKWPEYSLTGENAIFWPQIL